MNGNGLVDQAVASDLVAYAQLSAIANSSNPVALLRLIDAIETCQGNFLVTSFAKTGEQAGQVEFTSAFQNEGVVTFTIA